MKYVSGQPHRRHAKRTESCGGEPKEEDVEANEDATGRGEEKVRSANQHKGSDAQVGKATESKENPLVSRGFLFTTCSLLL